MKRRISKDNNGKNTLVFVEGKQTVFFSIARCNTQSGDKPNKRIGFEMARLRMMQFVASLGQVNTDFHLDPSGLCGCCSKHNLEFVFKYFNDIDWFMKNVHVRNQ